MLDWRRVLAASTARAEREAPAARADALPPNQRSVAERGIVVRKQAKEYTIFAFEKKRSKEERSRARLAWSEATEKAAAVNVVALRAADLRVSLATARAALTTALMKYESDVLRGDRKLTLTHRTLIKFMARLNFTSRRRMTTQMSTSVTEVQSRQLMKAFLSLSCSSCCDRFQSFVVLTEIVLLSSPPALPQRMHPSRLAQGTHHCVAD